MKDSPSPPPAPDPNVVSAAQTQSNQQTALFNAGLTDINQNTPLGSINYNIDPNYDKSPVDGAVPVNFSDGAFAGVSAGNYYESPTKTDQGYAVYDKSGKNVGYSTADPTQSGSMQRPGTQSGTPRVTSNITLNPDVQDALTSSLQTKAAEAHTAQNYLAQVNRGLEGSPPTADAAFQQKQVDNLTALQAPFVQRQQEQLRAELAAKGVTEGSTAWHSAMQDESNALNNQQQQNIANATGQEQAQFGMQQAAYTLPLNEFSALQSGSQVQQPSFATPQAVSAQPTNTSANAYNSYNSTVANNNAQMASQNALMSNLFGLGGTLGAAALLA